MSNLLFKKKERHYRNISNFSRGETTYEDLLSEYKSYKNSHSKKPSPNKASTIRVHRLCNSDDFNGENPKFTKTSTFRRNRTRLKYDALLEKNRSFELNALKSSKTSTELQFFLCTFEFLAPLSIEMELNSKLIGDKFPSSNKGIGMYHLLHDKLVEKSQINSTDDVNVQLKEYSVLFRDILRCLHDRKMVEEVINLDLIWKLMLKVIDNTLIMQEATVNKVVLTAEAQIKEINNKFNKILEENKNASDILTIGFKAQIADQARIIQSLKKENYFYDKLVKEKEAQITELLNPEGRNFSCQQMKIALEKLTTYINESETEQIKQVNTLRDLSSIMDVAEEINKKPETQEKSVQTDIEIVPAPPEPELPVVSDNPNDDKNEKQTDLLDAAEKNPNRRRSPPKKTRRKS